VDLVRRLIHEALRVQEIQGGLTLGVRERPRRFRAWGAGFRAWHARPVEGGARKDESAAGRRAADLGRELGGCRHEFSSADPASGSAIPSRVETFF
jgi:hypothetical protein